jgi:hypothetical protein
MGVRDRSRSSTLAWQRRLPGLPAEAGVTLVRVGGAGECTLVLCSDGTVLVFDHTGDAVVRTHVDMPAYVSPRDPGPGVVVWNSQEAVLLDADPGRADLLVFREPVQHLDCSRDLNRICTVSADGKLQFYEGSDTPSWFRPIEPRPVALYMSPDGKTMMTTDEEGRSRYFRTDGTLFRKTRIGGPEEYLPWGLGEGMTVFGDREGRLLVISAGGGQMWAGQPVGPIANAELVGACIAVYSAGAEGAFIDPAAQLQWDFNLPPGQARIRRPPGGEPVVVHSSGSTMTVFSGSGGALTAKWRVQCEADVVCFDVTRDAGVIVAYAGQELMRIELRAGR